MPYSRDSCKTVSAHNLLPTMLLSFALRTSTPKVRLLGQLVVISEQLLLAWKINSASVCIRPGCDLWQLGPLRVACTSTRSACIVLVPTSWLPFPTASCPLHVGIVCIACTHPVVPSNVCRASPLKLHGSEEETASATESDALQVTVPSTSYLIPGTGYEPTYNLKPNNFSIRSERSQYRSTFQIPDSKHPRQRDTQARAARCL